PGGSIRIVAASSRSVSMSETFDRPLVIGYLAYDRPIGKGGVLGGSVPTLQRIERRATATPPASVKSVIPDRPTTITSFQNDANTIAIRAWLRQPGNREILKLWLPEQPCPNNHRCTGDD